MDEYYLWLNKYLYYNSDTGILYWRVREETNKWEKMFNVRFSGKPVQNRSHGYIKFSIHKKRVYGHTAAMTLYEGKRPIGIIDHINGIKDDNRIDNLRLVNPSQSVKNTSRRRDNKSGCTGVYYSNNLNKWVSAINSHGLKHSLGCYDLYEDAVKARKEAEVKYGFHKNHGRG